MDFKELGDFCRGKDWFYEIGSDQYGRTVVYVHYMCHETLHNIPDVVDGKQVLVHFAASKTATREQFVDTPQAPASTLKAFEPKAFIQAAKAAQANGIDVGFGQMFNEDGEDKSILFLQQELDRLEKACSSRTLQDIFYEVQDGPNAVTNMSARYPEVRKRMEELYDVYGFDVIYEELDG